MAFCKVECEAPGEKQAVHTRTEADCPLEVAEGLLVVARANVTQGPDPVPFGKEGVEANRGAEIPLGSADIAEVIFGYASEVEGAVVA